MKTKLFILLSACTAMLTQASILPVQRDITLTATPIAHLPLQDSMTDVVGGKSISINGGGSAAFSTGNTLNKRAYDLTAANSLRVNNLGLSGDITIATYVYISDLSNFPTIFDNGTIRLAINDSAGGSTKSSNYKSRKSYLEFRVLNGATGGDGRLGNTMNSTYARIHEHSEDFVVDSAHKRSTDFAQAGLEHGWMHVAVVYSPSNKRVDFYINGKLDSQKYFDNAPNVNVSSLSFGGLMDNRYKLNGKLADIKIFNQALTEAEVRELDDFREDLWGIRDIAQWETPRRTFVVDPSYSGSTPNGSPLHPFNTITEAVDALNALSSDQAPGTRILIKPGEYREWGMIVDHHGTRFRPIQIEAEQPGTVTISGSVIWTEPWTYDSANKYYYTSWTNNWSGTTTDLEARQEVLHIDGIMARPYKDRSDTGLKAPLDDDPRSANGFYVSEYSNKIYLRTSMNPNNKKVEVSMNDKPLLHFRAGPDEGAYIFISGITFQHSRGSGVKTGKALSLISNKGVLIRDCSFFGNGEIGVETGRENILIENCIFENNGTYSFSFAQGSSYCMARDCEISQAAWRPTWSESTEANYASINKIMFSSRTYLHRNRFFNNDKSAIWADGQARDVTTDECYFKENSNHPVFYEISTLNLELRNSSFYRNGDSSAWVYCESFRIDNNLFFQNESDINLAIISSGAEKRTEQTRIADIYSQRDMVLRNNLILNTLSGDDNHHKLFLLSPNQDTLNSITSSGNTLYSGSGITTKVFGVKTEAPILFADWQSKINDSGSVMEASNPISTSFTPNITFEESSSRMEESLVLLPVHIQLSQPVEKTITVQLTLSATGGAQEGTDYRLIGEKTITFEPLERTRTVNIEAFFDTVAEGDESFRITLSSPTGANLGSQKTHTVTIAGSSKTLNYPPVLASYNVPEEMPIFVDYSISATGYDPENKSLSYQWKHRSGPSTVQFGSSQNATTTMRLAQLGDYEIDLIISDGVTSTTNLIEVSGIGAAYPAGLGDGTVNIKVWDNFNSGSISSMSVFSGMPHNPDSIEQLTELSYPNQNDDHHAAICEGYIVAPITGPYTFFVDTGYNAELWLSTSTSAADKQLIVIGSAAGQASNSTPVNLVAGQRYYFQTRHIQYTGSSELKVQWQTLPYRKEIISADYISATPFDLAGQATSSSNLIVEGDHWKYFKGSSDPGSNWMSTSYNDSSWASGPSGFGYADGDDATEFNDMRDNYTTLFIRKTFNISDLSKATAFEMTIDYDDSYEAYLNGELLNTANRRFLAAPLTNTSITDNDHAAEVDGGTADRFTILPAHFKEGENKLAIIVVNKEKTSSDLSMIPSLKMISVSSAAGDPNMDSDGDGINDFLEIAFATNPNVKDAQPFYTRTASGDIEYMIRNLKDGYTYQLETATNLSGPWSNYQGVYPGDTGGQPTPVTIPIGSDQKRYFRLKVTN